MRIIKRCLVMVLLAQCGIVLNSQATQYLCPGVGEEQPFPGLNHILAPTTDTPYFTWELNNFGGLWRAADLFGMRLSAYPGDVTLAPLALKFALGARSVLPPEYRERVQRAWDFLGALLTPTPEDEADDGPDLGKSPQVDQESCSIIQRPLLDLIAAISSAVELTIKNASDFDKLVCNSITLELPPDFGSWGNPWESYQRVRTSCDDAVMALAARSTGAVREAVNELWFAVVCYDASRRYAPEERVRSWAQTVRKMWAKIDGPDAVLLSYHNLRVLASGIQTLDRVVQEKYF
ncbi:MAG: hypothetical protein LBI20_01850 [Holosporales bacterium]|nr:hypothetical protein [Holosporales bacterium]